MVNVFGKLGLGFRLFIILFLQSLLLFIIQQFTGYTDTYLLGGLITLAILLSTTFLLYRILIKPIKDLANGIKVITDGDLTERLTVTSVGEVQVLIDSFNKMTDDLQTLVKHLQTNAKELKGTSLHIDQAALESLHAHQEISATVENTTNNIEKQNENIEVIQASLQEVNVSIEEISSATKRARTITEGAIETSDNGVIAIENVIDKLKLVNENTDNLQSILSRLEKESTNINSIVKVITQISEQTNLLALNATIEAARAGEHGKGFAVVANEVRKLAEESSKSASMISRIVNENITLTKSSVQSIDSLKTGLNYSNEIVQQSKQTLKSIKENSLHVDTNVFTISEHITQQVYANQELSRSVESISSLSHEIAEGAHFSNNVIKEQTTTSEKFKDGTKRLEVMTSDFENLLKGFKV
nr:methyl-accepting chemotaxis protein [Bacillus sp. FJAT-45350]